LHTERVLLSPPRATRKNDQEVEDDGKQFLTTETISEQELTPKRPAVKRESLK